MLVNASLIERSNASFARNARLGNDLRGGGEASCNRQIPRIRLVPPYNFHWQNLQLQKIPTVTN